MSGAVGWGVPAQLRQCCFAGGGGPLQLRKPLE
jgi:hypothetical protein